MRRTQRDKDSPYSLQALRKAARHLPIDGIVNQTTSGTNLVTELLYAYGYRISAILIAAGIGGLLGLHLGLWALPIVIPSCLCLGYIASKLETMTSWKEDGPMNEQDYMSEWISREVRLPPEGWAVIDDLSNSLGIHRDRALEWLALRGALSVARVRTKRPPTRDPKPAT